MWSPVKIKDVPANMCIFTHNSCAFTVITSLLESDHGSYAHNACFAQETTCLSCALSSQIVLLHRICYISPQVSLDADASQDFVSAVADCTSGKVVPEPITGADE